MKMKKTPFIKIGALVFGVSLFLWNCIREDFMSLQNTVTSNKLKYSLTKITYQELLADKEIKPSLPLIERRFSKHSPQSIHSRSATEVAAGLTIFTDEINRIVIDNVITWTFQTESPVLETSDFENFLVKKHNGVFTYFLVSYEFTDLTDSETLYEKATSYVISEEYLSLEDLNLSSRDAFDWVFPNDGSGTGSGPCESILVYDHCNLGGNPDGHWPVLQNDGVTYCSGSPLLYIDFSHCENYGVPDSPVGDPLGGDDGSGDQLIGGGGRNSDGDGDTTLTAPIELADPRCPPLASGKIYVAGLCLCPVGYREDPVTEYCVEDDCNTSKEDLKKIFPNASDTTLATLATVINEKAKDLGINTKEELQHFLAQAGHETGGFRTLNVRESLNYYTASLIPNRYDKFTMDTIANPTKLYAGDYINNEEKLANAAMCCKYENGDEVSGDGWNYRGRGILQLTWKENYRRFKEWYNNNYDPDKDFVANPDLISGNDTLAILSGLWYYKYRVLDKITVDRNATVEKVTKRINKAKTGLLDRKQRFQKAKDSINCKN